MVVPVFLLLLCLTGAAASLWVYGPVLSDPLLISAVSAIAAAILVLRARLSRAPRFIVVDGSNVLHWRDEQPSIETVRQVVGELSGRGYIPVVWFDANVGYKIGERYLGPYPLSRMLGLPARQVYVAPKGTPADPLLLDGAQTLEAKVVTNDRFRDWVKSHPQTTEAGFLVPGRVRGGEIHLDGIAAAE